MESWSDLPAYDPRLAWLADEFAMAWEGDSLTLDHFKL